jgi:hypothetical protein
MVSGNGCEKAYNCLNFMTREMYIENETGMIIYQEVEI